MPGYRSQAIEAGCRHRADDVRPLRKSQILLYSPSFIHCQHAQGMHACMCSRNDLPSHPCYVQRIWRRLPSPPRTAKSTLDQLASITCDPLDVEGYIDECSDFRLNGMFLPFWRNWPLADPSWFLTPEALHHWHHQFYDHDLWWCLRAVGVQEIDFCFSVL